ncbi:class I tRNA ligase family protein, partial [Candidatus Woesearchaeota archaeon]|nr:class I tRNA ligase family protein [Candidatus Woesearchaeota archaeon]
KMSKSLGNVIDPKEVIDKFGAEPFRLWCALEGNLEKDDMKCSFERIEGAGKTLTKLWNIAKFVDQFSLEMIRKKEKVGEELETHELTPELLDITLADLDKWIIKEMGELVKFSSQHYEQYDFHNPAVMARHFMWETFASHYLELAKNRAYNQHGKFDKWEQESAVFTLHYCLNTLLRLLAPVIPFVTSHIYKEIYNKDVHEEIFPKYMVMEETGISKDDIIELNNTIWKAKKEKGLSLKAEVKKIILPEKFRGVEKDVIATHGAADIVYGDGIQVLVYSNTRK